MANAYGKTQLKPILQQRVLEIDAFRNASRTHIRGLQLPKKVVFEDWDVGGKYVKSIFIYNPSAKIQRFLYEVPKSTAFLMGLPKPIKLYPKTGVKLNIQFHPKEKKDYNDKLFIKTAENEKILIKLQAITNIAFITGPEEIAFGMCGVSEIVQKTFTIKNNSRHTLDITWNVLQPFSIEPVATTIAIDDKCTLKAIFKPHKAAVYTCKAVCTPKHLKTTKRLYYTIKFTAQGVYPYLTISQSKDDVCQLDYEFDFGIINVNSSAMKEIILINPLPIKSTFILMRSNYHSNENSPFSFNQETGLIAPSDRFTLKAVFSPIMPNCELNDVWCLNVKGGFSTKTILMKGISCGPSVSLSTTVINFNEIERGSVLQKAIKITNSSTVNTMFQFEIDNYSSIFNFEPALGHILKQSTIVIQVDFRPVYPITYYRRIACVIHMQNPLYIDLIGTAISSEVQPERLQPLHLETFWLQVRKGQFFFKDDYCVLPVVTPKPYPPPVDEYLYDGYHSDFTLISPPISLDQHIIDFGKCCHNNYTPAKVFSVTNHTYFVLTLTWIGGPSHTFSIKPLIVDIQPHRTAVFHLTFKPTGTSQIYLSVLEGYAHCTGKGTDALNPGDFNWPPWCLTITAMGHTYPSEKGIYRANYELSTYRIHLPPVPVKSHAARTVVITNKTPTTKIVFNLTSDNAEMVVKPRVGVILKPFIIFTIGLTPRLPGPYSTCLYLETNFDKFSVQEIGVEGIASQPLLALDNTSGLYFKPVCVGTTIERIVTIHNISPISVNYHWTLKPIYKTTLVVDPLEGTISPHAIRRFHFYFNPKKNIHYIFKVSLTATSEGTFGIIVQKQQELTIFGDGDKSILRAEPANLEIGSRIVGTLINQSITLRNMTRCGVNVKLSIEEKFNSVSCSGIEIKSKKKTFFLGETKSDALVHMPAKCHRKIDFKVLPRVHGPYQYKLYYQKIATIKDEKTVLSNLIHLCDISMIGAHPSLQVVEARFLGSATKVRRDRAWELLSLEKLNEYLGSEPYFDNKSLELDETLFPLIDSMQSVTKSRKKINFYLPPASVNSAPCTLILLLRNPGQVECQWSIWYPWEQKVDVEIWAHTGLYLKTEIDEGRMKDDKLIQIQPKKGRLLPGETEFLSLVYTHQYPSQNTLPIRLSLHSGVDLLINIVAETFEKDIAQVHFPFTIHRFSPLSYGFSEGTVVSYNIPNHSDVAIKLRLDVLPLKRFQKLHYSHPVIDCLTRRLIIQPGEYLSILWQIWPLEERTYQVDIPIKFDSDTNFRTLTLLVPTSVRPEELPKTEKPAMILPNQPAVLSHDRISFGHVPVCGKIHKMFFIANNSSFFIKFDWYMPYKLLRQRIIFEPKTGRIGPNNSCMCQVTLMTGHTPAIYDIYCHAEVTMIKSGQALSKIKQHTRRSVHAPSSSALAVVKESIPIEQIETFHVHLELKAETHMLEDFWLFFPDCLNQYFIQRPRVRPQKDERFSSKRGHARMEIEQETIEVVFETMTTILYNALNDPDFAQHVHIASKDPTPYYFQIRGSFEYLMEPNLAPSKISLSSSDSFDLLYWTHSKIFSRQKQSFISKKPITTTSKGHETDIFSDSYVPVDLKTFPEAMIAVHSALEMFVWNILEEAFRKEFNIIARPRMLSNIIS